MKHLKLEQLNQAVSSMEYHSLLQEYAATGKTSGPIQSENLIQYTKLNAARSRRIFKRWMPQPELLKALNSIQEPMLWLCITETWCGDAAFYLPMFQKLKETSLRVELWCVLREANPQLMDAFLTNGARSIPKLIVLRKANLEVLAVWGPRTQAANEHRAALLNAALEPIDIAEGMQRWYLIDQGQSFQQEFTRVLTDISTMLQNQH